MATNIKMFEDALDIGVSSIPCKRTFDEKHQLFTGKMPAIRDWSAYCSRLPNEEEIEGWSTLNNVFGIAYVTGEASNLACIDIDTEDRELQERIKKAIPYTPCCIIGNPKRGGKFLYRLYDTIHEYKPILSPKVKVPDPFDPRKSAVDVFFGNAYVCAPPSLHSEVDGVRNWYSWEKHALDEVGMENLPILNPDVVEIIRMIVSGMTQDQLAKNLPKGKIDHGAAGRWEAITGLASSLIREQSPFEKAVQELLDFDAVEHKDNPYFLDKTKGCRTIDPRINAIKFYADMLSTVNMKKKREKDLEAPRQVVLSTAIEGNYWPEPTPLAGCEEVPSFDPLWIPERIREAVMSASESAAVSPQSVFFYMLGTFSSLIGNKAVIQPYRVNKSYTECSNLYVGLVAKSGERKTETTKMARRPLIELEKEEARLNKSRGMEVEQRNEQLSVMIKKIKKDIEKEIFDNGIDSEYGKQLTKEMDEHKLRLETQKDISLYEQYNTAERLYEIAEQNPTGLFIEFNEWGAMYDQLNSKESKNLRRFIMDGWDGNNIFKYGTKHNNSVVIEKLCLSVGFSVQEDVMASIVWRLLNIGRENDGLMQRFLLVPSDNDVRPIVDTDVMINDEVINLFRNAHFMEPSEERVMLSKPSYDAWLKFQEENRDKRVKETIPALESFLSKYDGYIIRIASNLAHIENNGERVHTIPHESFQQAHEIITWLEASLRVLFDQGANKRLEEVVNQMRMSIIEDGIRVRDLCRTHKGLFSSSSIEAMEMLETLHQHNYLRVVKEGKSFCVRVNPKLTK